MSASSLTSWALLAWQELNARQIDANALFLQANLDPKLLNNAVARYPIRDLQTLWQLAEERCGVDFGICAGKRWNPTTFHALGFAWLASESLAEALFRVARYGKFLNDGVHYELKNEALTYRFILKFNPVKTTLTSTQLSPLSLDASISSLLIMIRMLLGEAFSPVSINCPHPPNSASFLMEQLARCPIHYDGEHIEFTFHRQDVEKKLFTGNVELGCTNEQIIARHLAELDTGNLINQVELLMTQQLPSGNIKEDNIAQQLNMSGRTLQRKLADSGTSFKKILETTRQQLARRYVSDDSLAISEVAYLLGFSEQANFTRAFKRWYGESPSQYRLKICA